MEAPSANVNASRRAGEGGALSDAVSELFGAGMSWERHRRVAPRNLPARYKTALEAEAPLQRSLFLRSRGLDFRRGFAREGASPLDRGQSAKICQASGLLTQEGADTQKKGSMNAAEYHSIFGPNGSVERAKRRLIATRFNPRKALY